MVDFGSRKIGWSVLDFITSSEMFDGQYSFIFRRSFLYTE